MNSEDIYKLTSHPDSMEPLIFKNILKWKILNWDLDDWSKIFKDEKLTFRKIPFVKTKEPIWENQCEKITLTMTEFIKFQNVDPHEKVDKNYALYFDYKYMKDYFHNFPEVLKEVKWADLGYNNIYGNESTIWIGSSGSHTLCHQDTYGYNLVAQIYGCKEWILFPPKSNLKPTRVPYEESTIFSKLNLFCPEIDDFKDIENARRIILKPGDVLFLPHGWWHYVENLNTAISINTWVPIPETDTIKRIEEGLVSIFIQSFIKNTDPLKTNLFSKFLNLNSEFLIEENASELFPILKNSIEELHKMRNEPKIVKDGHVDDINEILKNNIEYVEVIKPFKSIENFQLFLTEKINRYRFDENYLNNSSDIILENILNSFCDPNNISRVADEFIKKSMK